MAVSVCAQLWPSEQGIQEHSLYVFVPAEGQILYFQLQEEAVLLI